MDWRSRRPPSKKVHQQSKFRSSGLTVDVTSEDALKEFFAIVGPFDHLVYTAGDDLPIGPLAGIDLCHARARFEVRYWGAVGGRQMCSRLRNTYPTGSVGPGTAVSGTLPRP